MMVDEDWEIMPLTYAFCPQNRAISLKPDVLTLG